jgi:hypothetical protein
MSVDIYDFQFGFSYDYNLSSFKTATNGNGATELLLVYKFYKRKVVIPKQNTCPVFL